MLGICSAGPQTMVENEFHILCLGYNTKTSENDCTYSGSSKLRTARIQAKVVLINVIKTTLALIKPVAHWFVTFGRQINGL